jgi:hypothetical protein
MPDDGYTDGRTSGQRRKWTQEDINLLRKLWADTSWEELQRALGRSRSSIKNKAVEIGVTASNPRRKFQNLHYKGHSTPPDVLTLEREIAELRRRLGEQDMQYAIFRQYLDAAIGGIQPPDYRYEPPTEPKRHTKEEAGVLLLGDLQYGSEVLMEKTGGLASYSRAAFLQRLGKALEAIIEIVDIKRESVVLNDLWIAGVGDYVEGENVYIGQAFELEVPMLRQVVELGDIMPSRFFSPLCAHFQDVYFRGLGGNHGKYHRMPSNWDCLAMHQWQLRMQEHDNFHMHFEWDKLWTQFRMYDWPHDFLVTHGNQVRAWQNIPWYGLDRAWARYIAMLGIAVNYLFVGHHHQALFLPTLWGAMVMNGSTVGGSHYSHDRMIKVGPPAQMFLTMNKDHVTGVYPLFLEDPPKLEYDEDGILTYEGAEHWVGKEY